ncbi:MAG: hypothetical protein ACAH80_07495 [Alphaproteobacteria bacterium]
MPVTGFKNTLVICFAIALGMLMSARTSTGEARYDGRYQMHLNDVNGYNFLLDTATGETWTMFNMVRLGRPVAVWVPSLRADSFAQSDKLMNEAQMKALEPLKK